MWTIETLKKPRYDGGLYMKILIQKFGGTSVSTSDRRQLVIDKIQKAIEEGFSPVVVVSAMGRKGEPYATDSLLELISEEYRAANLLSADLLMSCGEIISTVVMSCALYHSGIIAQPLTGFQAGIITDNSYSKADVQEIKTEYLLKLLKRGIVPVVAGFQGVTEEGIVTTLGRGGSDVTAALLGVALKAQSVEIYTDVDGIMTADPRIVSEAALIQEMNYNEVYQFADQGAKVIHPRAIEIAMQKMVPLIIKNTLSDSIGTIIDGRLHEEGKLITGITHMSNRVQIIVSLKDNMNNDNYHYLLDELGKNQISIDLINIFPKEQIFTIDEEDLIKFTVLAKEKNIKYTAIENCSKIAVIGSRIRGIPGVMARIIKALTSVDIEVLQTADSHTTIWCLVESKYTGKAINALHEEFKLGQ